MKKIGSFVKENKTFLLWVVFAVVSFMVATILLNKFTYNMFVVDVNPFATVKKLWAVLPRATKTRFRILKPLVSFFGVLLLYVVCLFTKIYKVIVFGSQNRKYKTRKNENERETIKGSAHWADLEEIKSCGYLFPYTDEGIPPIIFGQSNDAVVDAPNPFKVSTRKKGKYVIGCDVSKEIGKTPTVNHTMIIGVTRCGKGVGTIIPTLLSYKSSAIIYDPACENYERTAGYRRNFGAVQYFNPQDMESTLHFNPLEWIRKEKNFIMTDIGNMSQIIVPENPKANDSFWDNSARNLINIYIAYVLIFYPKEMQTMKEVANVARIMKEKDMFSLEGLKYKMSRLNSIINRDVEGLVNREEDCARRNELMNKLETERTRAIAQAQKLKKFVEDEEERQQKIQGWKEEARADLKGGGSRTPYGRVASAGDADPSDEQLMAVVRRKHPEAFKDEVKAEDGMLGMVNKMFSDIDKERNMLLSEKENPDNGWKMTCLNQTWNALNKLRSSAKSENTIASIVSVADTNLQFYADENIANLMDRSTFSAEDLTMKDYALSLYLCILNQDTERCKTFVKLFVTMVSNMLSRDAEEYKEKGKQTVLFILDEFPQLGKMKAVYNMIPFIGKFGVVFMLITQDLMQLEEAYGKEGAASMINNMQLVNIKKVGLDQETRSMVSKLLGNKTVILDSSSSSVNTGSNGGSVSLGIREEQRPLMTEDEVGRMSNADQLIIVPSVSAILAKKLQWFCEPIFKARESQRNPELPLDSPESEDPNGLSFFSSIMTLPQEIEEEEPDDNTLEQSPPEDNLSDDSKSEGQTEGDGQTESGVTESEIAVVSEENGHESDAAGDDIEKGEVIAGIVNFEEHREELKRRFVAFDCETTGLSPENDRIVEIGLVLFENGKKAGEYCSLVKTDRSIPSAASRVNHITDDMIAGAPCEKEVYGKVVSFADGAIKNGVFFVAHNASFDMAFVSNALSRFGYNFQYKCIDTLEIARKYLAGQTKNSKLGTIADFFGISNKDKHRASGDAEVCGELLLKFMAMLDCDDESGCYENGEPDDMTVIRDKEKQDEEIRESISETGEKGGNERGLDDEEDFVHPKPKTADEKRKINDEFESFDAYAEGLMNEMWQAVQDFETTEADDSYDDAEIERLRREAEMEETGNNEEEEDEGSTEG